VKALRSLPRNDRFTPHDRGALAGQMWANNQARADEIELVLDSDIPEDLRCAAEPGP
jgi:hypothetical protein